MILVLTAIAIYVCIVLASRFLFPVLLGGSLLGILILLLTSNKKKKWAIRFNSAAVISVMTYIALEFITYGLLSFGIIRTDMVFFVGGFIGSNRPLVVYDTICGYRMEPGIRRHMSIAAGEVEFDHLTVVNAQGWYSKREYHRHKGEKKRYMVLGDSYSAGLSTPLTWVDILQDQLEASGNDSVELYNFSQEGAGLENWHRIYHHEILPNYEFDGIIYAVSSEKGGVPDWDRNFITGQSYSDATYMKVLDLNTTTVPRDFDNSGAIPFFSIYPDAKMDEIKEAYLTGKRFFKYQYKKPDLYFLRTVSLAGDFFHAIRNWENNINISEAKNVAYEALVEVPYQEVFFRERYKNAHLLYDIWKDCKAQGHKSFWVTIPDYENALQYVQGNEIIYRREANYMTGRFGAKWFDGFDIFKGKDEAFVNKCYYKHDGHWNSATVEAFSKQMALYIHNQ